MRSRGSLGPKEVYLSLTNIATSVRAFRSVEAAPSYPRKAISRRSSSFRSIVNRSCRGAGRDARAPAQPKSPTTIASMPFKISKRCGATSPPVTENCGNVPAAQRRAVGDEHRHQPMRRVRRQSDVRLPHRADK